MKKSNNDQTRNSSGQFEIFTNPKTVTENSVHVNVNKMSDNGEVKFVRRMSVYQFPVTEKQAG